jgi:hypothetical protein
VGLGFVKPGMDFDEVAHIAAKTADRRKRVVVGMCHNKPFKQDVKEKTWSLPNPVASNGNETITISHWLHSYIPPLKRVSFTGDMKRIYALYS